MPNADRKVVLRRPRDKPDVSDLGEPFSPWETNAGLAVEGERSFRVG